MTQQATTPWEQVEPRASPVDAPGRTWDGPSVASAEPLHDLPLRGWVRRAVGGDLLAAVLASSAAVLLRFGRDSADLQGSPVQIDYALIGLVVALAWPFVNAMSGAYDHKVMLFGVEEIRRVLRSAVSVLAGLALLHFVFHLSLARGYVGVLIPLIVLFTVVWRFALRWLVGRRARAGGGSVRHRAVAVGGVAELERMYAELQDGSSWAIEVVAFVADDLDDDEPVTGPLGGLRRLRSRDHLATLADDGVGYDLILRAGRPDQDEMWALARRAHDAHVALAIAPARSDAANVAVSYVPLGSTPLLLVETPALRPAHLAAKAIFDRVAAALLLVVTAPLLAAIAVSILVRDGGPVLFRQERVGRDGNRFRVYKFRTMVRDAEDMLVSLAERNEAGGPLFKVREDPRITRTGRWLRRRSLDELPQLLNVIRGDMSLVGPRPPLPDEVATYDARTARRLLVKPGMTGLWQVNGRSDLPWDEGVYLDLLYIDHWSPLIDIVILVRTFVTLVRPRGAY